MFRIRKNCHRNRRNLLLYLLIKEAVKLTVVIIQELQIICKLLSHFLSNLNSISRYNYWGLSMWILT